jgi:hypothetical protein
MDGWMHGIHIVIVETAVTRFCKIASGFTALDFKILTFYRPRPSAMRQTHCLEDQISVFGSPPKTGRPSCTFDTAFRFRPLPVKATVEASMGGGGDVSYLY